MNSVTVQSSSHDYEVLIGKGLRRNLGEVISTGYTSILVITDSTVQDYYLQDVQESLSEAAPVFSAVVPAGESSKSMGRYEELLDRCVELKLDRKSLIIALGGGMIGDLAGFVASTYLRGIDYIQMPTTILAHDSSVGGKVAINHPKGKNLIGSFYHPVKVIYDMETIETLPESEIRSGYGEVMKHAFLSDAKWAHRLLKGKLSELSVDQLESDLMRGIQVKASIVEKDEREAGIRKYLNLGHTLAHAIEAELGYGEITHGEAVAVGLLLMMKLSNDLKGAELPLQDYKEWLERNNYPISVLNRIRPEQMVEKMKLDKKTVRQKINFVLLHELSDPYVVEIEENQLVEHMSLLMDEVSGE
ncbi:3-dehydroquinate synthase [Halobacillus sp. Nhm2S1]|uniref:3-dehydroquinate synthase n=1 Tax=Halobacillus sp. Nhm2S1 TaxID=2866716 RepID=UPI001C72FE3A|nr:3-dehydroquinate synthase [Halobacillus sp. Nhm2S1]MBX0356222.1 3-dehydroquinate synthase [Halobacillus sp. Nhm2S1]